MRQLDPLFDASSPSLQLPHLQSIHDVRAVRAGARMFVDLVAVLSADTTMRDAHLVQEEIKRRLMSSRKEISEVRIKLVPDAWPEHQK